MSDEIKEILNRLEIVARKHTIKVCEDGSKIETMPASVIDELRLNNYSSKLLLDYITNLQQENENLKDFNNKLQATKDRLDKYDRENQLEIDRLNNITNELKDKINEILDYLESKGE